VWIVHPNWSCDQSNRAWRWRNVNCGRFMGRRARIPWWWRRVITVRVYVLDGNLTGQKYRDNVFAPRVVPHFDNHALADRPMFMDDNTRPHRARIVQHVLQSWSEHIVTVYLSCQITIKNVQVQLTVKGKLTPDSYTPLPKAVVPKMWLHTYLPVKQVIDRFVFMCIWQGV
jgi:hypothetical protein